MYAYVVATLAGSGFALVIVRAIRRVFGVPTPGAILTALLDAEQRDREQQLRQHADSIHTALYDRVQEARRHRG